jgi:hypothetical protein
MLKTLLYFIGAALVFVSFLFIRECNSHPQFIVPPPIPDNPSDKAIQDFIDALKKSNPDVEKSLVNYANAYSKNLIKKGINSEIRLGIQSDTIHFKKSEGYCNNYINDRCNTIQCGQNLEKSIYFPSWQIISNIDSIQKYNSSYPDDHDFGFRIYLAKYPDDYRVSEKLNGKYTAVVRFTYQGSDIPFPSGTKPQYSPTMNLGDLCPPKCLNTTKLPGPYGFYTEN